MSEAQELLAVIRANGEFTKKLYNILSLKGKNENLFFSPISAHAVLSMAYLGARGDTEVALAQALNIPNTKTILEGYKEVIFSLNNVSKVKLHLANKIFIQEKYLLHNDFDSAVKTSFFSEVHPLNFANNTEAAATINNWVEEKTNNKIKDLIQANDLNPLTKLVLVNAIYFKGDWANKFDPKNTKIEKFYLNEMDTTDIQMMNLSKKHFFYKEDNTLDAKIIELPYIDHNVSLVIILPKTKDGIEKLENNLATTDLTKITDQMRRVEVNLKLPKFKVETQINLNEALSKLGLDVIFDSQKADFSGINPDDNLYVSKVIQKAFIEVNEEGAEAAAATGMVMRLTCAIPVPKPVVEFFADHPFMINLVYRQGLDVHLLFTGRINNPK